MLVKQYSYIMVIEKLERKYAVKYWACLSSLDEPFKDET
jgi:hypothetical protein